MTSSEELGPAVVPCLVVIEQSNPLVREEGVLELPRRRARDHVVKPRGLWPLHHLRPLRPLAVDDAAATARCWRRGVVGVGRGGGGGGRSRRVSRADAAAVGRGQRVEDVAWNDDVVQEVRHGHLVDAERLVAKTWRRDFRDGLLLLRRAAGAAVRSGLEGPVGGGVDAHLPELLLDVGVPVVLDLVVRPSRQVRRDLGPPVAQLRVQVDHRFLLLLRQLPALQVRPQVVGPPQPAALPATQQSCSKSTSTSESMTPWRLGEHEL
jgi:hypothetical protein